MEVGVAESYGKAHSQGVEKVRIESNEEGMKEGFPEATSEYAQRLNQDGVPDSEIHRYTQLSLKEIGRFRNGSSGTGWLQRFRSNLAGIGIIPVRCRRSCHSRIEQFKNN